MKIYTKEEIQKRVLHNGEIIDINNFTWDEKTRTFSSRLNNLVFDFNNIDSCTFDTGYSCTFKTGGYCTFNTGSSCTFDTGGSCTFKTGYYCTFKTGDSCTFNTGGYCTFNTGYSCTFKTGGSCTFKTGDSCTFDTGGSCTFDIFEVGYILSKQRNCVYIIRHNNNMKIYTNNNIKDNMLTRLSIDSIDVQTLREIQIIDSSIMIIKSKRQVSDFSILTAYYINDYFKDSNSHIMVAQKEIEGIVYSAHGGTVKQAMRDVIFKYMSSQDVQIHVKRVKEVGIVTAFDYRLLTGSCEAGTRKFCTDNDIDYDTIELSINEVIELTKDAYMGDKFRELLS